MNPNPTPPTLNPKHSTLNTQHSHTHTLTHSGVTKGFEYKMKMVYAHFPINVACDKTPGSKANNKIEIRNYLGEKVRLNPSLLLSSLELSDTEVYEP